MSKVRVYLRERSYNIFIKEDILDQVGNEIRKKSSSQKAVIITDKTVGSIFGQRVLESLEKKKFETVLISVPDGERSKSFLNAERILSEMFDLRLDRITPVVALGGGVVGDLAGFVASIFLRGVPLIHVPTTLLAQVDSSIGGKTGVNHTKGKNLIGTFYQPSMVLIDPNTLKTIPERQARSGLAEVVKYGIIRNKSLFEFIEDNFLKLVNRDTRALSFVIKECCQIKADIVSSDEREQTGIRSLLNFGHTIGHAIETATGYKRFSHGEAISMGMVYAAEISQKLVDTPKEDIKRVEVLLSKMKLPVRFNRVRDKNISEIVRSDKKVKGKTINFVVMKKLGNANIYPIPVSRLIKYLN